VQIVEPEHQRTRAGQALEQVAQRAVHAMPVGGDGFAERRQHAGERLGVVEAEPAGRATPGSTTPATRS
jgi:hypothetical protein